MTLLGVAKRLGLPWRIFADDPTDPYLLRVHLTPDKAWWRRYLPGVALNYFYRGDKSTEFHSHEWRWLISCPLSNGYIEYRKDDRYAPVRICIRRPGSLNFIWKNTFHRIELDDPTRGALTLVVMAPRDVPDGQDSDWGFVDADGGNYEHWRARKERLAREQKTSPA